MVLTLRLVSSCVTLEDRHPCLLASPYTSVLYTASSLNRSHHDVHRRQVLCSIVWLHSNSLLLLENSLLIFHIKSTIIMIFSHDVALSSICVCRRTTRLLMMMRSGYFLRRAPCKRSRSIHYYWGCIFVEGDTHTKLAYSHLITFALVVDLLASLG